MEPITHLLTGACLARTGLNRTSALATATLVLAAEAPDLDVFTEFGGSTFGFAHHRGFSHTLLGVPVVAAFVVGLLYAGWKFWHRRDAGYLQKPHWGILFGLGCLAALSHLLLDFTNAYGVRPFMPFSYRWFSWDIMSIAEPVLWVILVGGLLIPTFFGLVDSEIGVRRHNPRGRVAAVVALSLMVGLWGFRDFEHRRAIAAMEALTYRGQDAIRVSAYPYSINPFHWYGVVETRSFFDRMEVNSRIPEVDPEGNAEIRYKPEETPVTLAAKKSYLGRVYLNWAKYPVTEVEELEGPNAGYVVRFYDLRYWYPGSRSHGGFLSGWVQLGPNLNVVAQKFGPAGYPGRFQRYQNGRGMRID